MRRVGRRPANRRLSSCIQTCHEARLDRLEARMERMERRMDDQFRETAAGNAWLEGLIQGLHGPHPGTSPRGTERPT